jgi:hypothetical protein
VNRLPQPSAMPRTETQRVSGGALAVMSAYPVGCLNNGGSGLGLNAGLCLAEGLTMSETLESRATNVDRRQLAEQLLPQAKEQGVELMGPGGLLNQLTKNVLETALDTKMAEHLGYDEHDPGGRGSGNFPNSPQRDPGHHGAHRDRPRCRSRYRGTPTAASIRRSSASVSVG